MRGDPLDGMWPDRWEKQPDGFGKGRQRWQAGWDRGEAPPPDPKGNDAPGSGWRDVGLVAQDHKWKEAHAKRRRVVRLLRRSGYVSRKRWARDRVGVRQVGCHVVDDYRYTDGPAEGLQAVDPWKMAKRLHGCGSRWYVQPRWRKGTGLVDSLVPLPLPALCGQVHVCSVCAQLRSRSLARALRAAIEADGGAYKVKFVTLGQRARRGESLDDAIARWRAAWRRVTRGRPGQEWKAMARGYYYGMEVTRGDGANEANPGPWWHVHAHMLVQLTGDFDEGFATRLAERWAAATEAVDPDGSGWDALSGCQNYSKTAKVGWTRTTRAGKPAWQEPASAVRARIAQGDYSGPWMQDLDVTDGELANVYQAAKYPTPSAWLHPLPLAEFLSAAHGRRWHQGGGAWRGVIKEGADLADAAREDGVDLGRGFGRVAPGEAPTLDEVANGLGFDGADCEPAREWVEFRVASTEEAEDIAWRIDAEPGQVDGVLIRREGWRNAVVKRGATLVQIRVPEQQWWLRLHVGWVRERMFAVLAELRSAREQEQEPAGPGRKAAEQPAGPPALGPPIGARAPAA
jgi:hypothetical protein